MNESKEFIDGKEVVVRFDYGPQHYGPNGEKWDEPYVCITEVCIGGVCISGEFFATDWLTNTELLILAEKGASLQAEYEMCAWEANQERLMEEGYP